MSLPVFFQTPKISLRLPRGRRVTIEELCRQAGVSCRVTGLSARRQLHVADAPLLRAVRSPGPLGPVWVGVPYKDVRKRALHVLGMLAYGVFDYAARECLRGLEVARPSPGRGRPRTGRALSAAERKRLSRQRLGYRGQDPNALRSNNPKSQLRSQASRSPVQAVPRTRK